MANHSLHENQAWNKQKCSFLGNPAGFKLFFNERDSDVTIKVQYQGEKLQFPAHKLVLCTMSDVFRTMLEVDMLEKNTRTIVIKDCSPLTIKQFLKYLYMGVVDFSDWNEAISILQIAHKYNVQTLINLCEGYLVCNIHFNNVCFMYELSRTYGLNELEKQCQDFIMEAGFIVSATDGFFNLKPASIEHFLSSAYFNMENEGCVLTCLREWAVCECTRKCVSLTSSNILAFMKPFLRFIQWNLIPECHRTFIPSFLLKKIENQCSIYRKPLHIPGLLQYHIHYIRCSVELGTFYQEDFSAQRSLPCLKFSVDNHIFFVGFRIIGLFNKFKGVTTAPNFLIIRKDDGRVFIQLNLMSLPWTRGATVGCHVWQEMVAYLPYPVRVDPFNPYILSLRSTRSVREDRCVKWPITRLDPEPISTHLGTINLNSHGTSYGITQLFILPAPPYKNICNRDAEDF